MADSIHIDKTGLLKKLGKIKYEPKKGSEDAMIEEMSMAKSLLKLAQIDHEKEYSLCRSVADHLLEDVPEPEEIDFDID